MKLTKKKALELCRDMWTQLASNGDAMKPDTKFQYNCPCCEYVCQQIPSERGLGMSCGGDGGVDGNDPVLKLCPLRPLWPHGCCADKSPFWEWCNSPLAKNRKRHALTIANACRAELKKIKTK